MAEKNLLTSLPSPVTLIYLSLRLKKKKKKKPTDIKCLGNSSYLNISLGMSEENQYNLTIADSVLLLELKKKLFINFLNT